MILLGLCAAYVAELVELPKKKKEYAGSAYFKDFNLPFQRHLLYSPEYRFYNSAKARNIPIDYGKQESNGLAYVVFENVLYIFPDFEQIDFSEEKSIWEVDYDGDWKPFADAYENLVSKLEVRPDVSCIKVLVERKMFPRTDLRCVDIPDGIFLTWCYENAFQNEDSPLKLCVPTNPAELLELMHQTPDLCGEYHLADHGNILWDLYDAIQIDMGVTPGDCYIGVNRKVFGQAKYGITHWHPTAFELYDDVCNMGKRGNVLVIRTFLLGARVLYMGDRENCPYHKQTRQWFGKVYIFEAK